MKKTLESHVKRKRSYLRNVNKALLFLSNSKYLNKTTKLHYVCDFPIVNLDDKLTT